MSDVVNVTNELIREMELDEQIFFFLHPELGVKTRKFTQEEIVEHKALLKRLVNKSQEIVAKEIQKKEDKLW